MLAVLMASQMEHSPLTRLTITLDDIGTAKREVHYFFNFVNLA